MHFPVLIGSYDPTPRRNSFIFGFASVFLSIFLLAIAPNAISSNALAAIEVAQNTNNPQYNRPELNPDVPRNQHTFAQSVMIEVISATFCLVTGIDPITPAQGCLGIDPQTHKLGLSPPADGQPQLGGLLGIAPGMFAQIYTPPASSLDYVRYLSNNFGVVEPAHAQVNGFEALQPIQNIWIAVRNLSYLIFVIIFVIIGLAIMLRVKIDPRTVMTIQNQIPRVIISILLITFSYAIVGLMIDIMWLSTYTGINLITQANPVITNPLGCTNETLQKRASQGLVNTPFSYGDSLLEQEVDVPIPVTGGTGGIECDDGVWGTSWNVSIAMGGIVGNTLVKAVTGNTGEIECNWGTYFKDVPIIKWFTPAYWSGEQDPPGKDNSCVSYVISTTLSFLTTIIAVLIVACIILFMLFRIWFVLLKAYVMIILYAISGPLWIIMGLLPARDREGKPYLGFGKWFRRIFANLAIFPATALLLTTAAILMNAFNNNAAVNNFVPPLVGNPNMQYFGTLLAFGLLLATPGLLEIIKESVHASGQQGKMAAATIANSVAGGSAPAKGLGQRAWNTAFWKNPYTRQSGPGWNKLMGKKPETFDNGDVKPGVRNRFRQIRRKAVTALGGLNRQDAGGHSGGGTPPGGGTAGGHG